jgi:hypothetical protein
LGYFLILGFQKESSREKKNQDIFYSKNLAQIFLKVSRKFIKMEGTMILEKKVKVSKEADELTLALVGIVETGKRKLSDGFQVGEDLSAIFAENLTKLMTGLDGVQNIGEEFKEDVEAFTNAWVLAGTRVMGLLLKKE